MVVIIPIGHRDMMKPATSTLPEAAEPRHSPVPGRLLLRVAGRICGREGNDSMLKLAIIFLIISLVAGALGFTGISVAAARIAKILFVVFGLLFLLFVLFAVLLGEALF
jgi:uncharacterized membrane protein YtjA (UPF0391 family)